MKIWRLITHDKYRQAASDWGKQNSRITIGWGNIGDIGKQGYSSSREINKAIHEKNHDKRSNGGGPSLWRFYKEMRKGDLVILKAVKLERVVKVVGDYEWNNAPLILNDGNEVTGEHYHQRLVEPTSDNPKQLWESVGGEASGENIRWTLILCR